MRASRFQFVAMVALVSMSCNAVDRALAPESVPPPLPPLTPPPTPTRGPTTSVVIGSFTADLFVGASTWVWVQAFDSQGRRIDSDRAVVTSSNPSVISVSGAQVTSLTLTDGYTIRESSSVITMVGVGSADIRVSLDGAYSQVTLRVGATPPASNALVVDSFSVVEYHEQCSWACPYIVYAPQLKLREPTGASNIDIIAVQFDISNRSTGWCSAGDVPFRAGTAAIINYIDPYLWANDMIVVQLDGLPLPAGPAVARVIVRDAQGKFGLVEATTQIQRNIPKPTFEFTPFAGFGWTCVSRDQSPG